jgi:hypothetical protein
MNIAGTTSIYCTVIPEASLGTGMKRYCCQARLYESYWGFAIQVNPPYQDVVTDRLKYCECLISNG